MKKKSIIRDYRLNENGNWEQLIDHENKDGKDIIEWCGCAITDVPQEILLNCWESLISELSSKESRLNLVKESYEKQEFEIVYLSDIDFKALYGSTAEKVRKQHASQVLKILGDEIKSLELCIQWVKHYIPLLRECIRRKQNCMPPRSPIILSSAPTLNEKDVEQIKNTLGEWKQ